MGRSASYVEKRCAVISAASTGTGRETGAGKPQRMQPKGRNYSIIFRARTTRRVGKSAPSHAAGLLEKWFPIRGTRTFASPRKSVCTGGLVRGAQWRFEVHSQVRRNGNQCDSFKNRWVGKVEKLSTFWQHLRRAKGVHSYTKINVISATYEQK